MVMLWRKMLRDIWENKIAYIACIFVVAIGLMSYTAMSIAKDSLFTAKDQFYEQYDFADGFVNLRAFPISKLESLEEMDGIETVSGRLVKDVRVMMPEIQENVYLRLISLHQPDGNELNNVQIINGAFPKESQRQILLADKFYQAHQMQIGASLDVIIDAKQVELSVSGSGQSPEYVYALKELQSMITDPKTFEVAYLPYADMEVLFKQTGIVNDLSFTLMPGVEFADVEHLLEEELKSYGLESLYAAEDQLSNAMLTEELNGLDKMSQSIPVIFLSIAGIILYIMLKRLVESQRGQIGMLSAFGYSKSAILVHYLNYGLCIGLLGGTFGGVFGTVLSRYYVQLFQDFFSLPNLAPQFSWKYLVIGVALSAVFSLAASFQGVRSLLTLQPADAMRPPVPVFVKKTWVEKLPLLWRLFTVQGRMAIRNLLRNKGRSFFTFIGMVFTFGMMASFFSIGSMMEMMILDQFTTVQKQDVKINFTKALSRQAMLRELQHTEGVQLVEPYLEIPVSLKYLNHKEDVVALGIIENSNLYNVFGQSGEQISIPTSGITLSEQIAEKLDIQVGDRIQFDSSYAKDDEGRITVEKVIPQYLGANVYLDQETLIKMLNQGDLATAALLAVDSSGVIELKEKYSSSKYVANIEVRQEMIDNYQELMGLTAYMLSIMAVIAILTGFAIVYNSSIISLAERERELASLRVMGMTSKEVMSVISIEQWLIGFTGMIAGIPFAFSINQLLSKGLSSDLYTIPSGTGSEAIVQAFFGTILAIWISQVTVARKVKRLDLVSVLKERE